MAEVLAYIALGSNLANPEAQLKTALEALASLPRSRLQVCSSLYRSVPMGPTDQPDYVNAVAALSTELEPEFLLDRLQDIEGAQGRIRAERWGPRTLDLDIVLYGDAIVVSERLKIPHPGIAQRNFVLYPLAEINRHLDIPGLGPVSELLEQCSDAGLCRLPARATSAA